MILRTGINEDGLNGVHAPRLRSSNPGFLPLKTRLTLRVFVR